MNSNTPCLSDEQPLDVTAKTLEHVTFKIPTQDGEPQEIPLYTGNAVFVIGPNGTGKSSLLQKLYADNRNHARRIAAHRQTWLAENASDLSPANKPSVAQNIAAQDVQDHSRWRDDYARQRVSVSLFELIDAENTRARQITTAVDSENEDEREKLRRKPAPYPD